MTVQCGKKKHDQILAGEEIWLQSIPNVCPSRTTIYNISQQIISVSNLFQVSAPANEKTRLFCFFPLKKGTVFIQGS